MEMASTIASCARELELGVARAARRGHLDVSALLESYVHLEPGSHPHLANPRRVDIDAVATALGGLPSRLLDTETVLIVPRLDTFEHEPIESSLLPAGQLADGTLLVEASFGLISLTNLAGPLCILAHEVIKAGRLLDATSRAAKSATDGAAAEDNGAAAEDNGAAAEEDGAAAEDNGAAAEDNGAAAEEDGAADNDIEDAADDASADLAHVAFCLGVDQLSLEAANARTDGALLRLLSGEATLPQVRIHVELQPEQVAARATTHAHRALALLAEMGLVDRPIHLWLGDSVITECLSPYARELREVILAWARSHPDQVGNDAPDLLDQAGEDLVYALIRDFVRSDAELARERVEADRTVGILRHEVGGLPFEVVDLGRIESGTCDARLSPWPRPAGPSPVLVRITPDLEDTQASGLRALLAALASRIASLTLVLEGTTLSGQPGTILLPNVMVGWAGEEKLSIPEITPFDLEDFVSYTETPVQGGAILSVPSATLLSPAHMARLAQTYGIGAVEVGGASLVSAIVDARWSSTLPLSAGVRWALVGIQAASTDRPNVASIAACSAIAITTLRHVMQDRRATEEPKRPSGKKPGPSSRAVRIKA